MRLIHTSDWHLGRRLFGQDLLAHQAEQLGWLLDLARAEAADAVLVSGDVYDRAQPGADAVTLMDRTVAVFAAAGVPLIVTSGNHDSAARLQYGGEVMAHAGIHLRTSLEQATDPVLLTDEHGPVGVYGIPYLLPDAVVESLRVARSHEAVLAEVTDRIRADAAQRGLSRTVVMSHSFVVGGAACESERDIRVGGVQSCPAGIFDGFSYVALGHLHGPQDLASVGGVTRIAYSGSMLAFSFSERDHAKSVAVVDIDGSGEVAVRRVATPVPRRLRQVVGRLDDLLAGADEDPDLAQAWLKVVLTDPGRVASPLERLKEKWPHTLVLEFAPEGFDAGRVALVGPGQSDSTLDICCGFVEHVGVQPPTETQRELLDRVVNHLTHEELSA